VLGVFVKIDILWLLILFLFIFCVYFLLLDMSYLLKKLSSKQEVDDAVRSTEDLVLVLRFGKDSDLTCMQLDEIVS